MFFTFEMHVKNVDVDLGKDHRDQEIAKILCHVARLYWMCVYMRRTNMFLTISFRCVQHTSSGSEAAPAAGPRSDFSVRPKTSNSISKQILDKAGS